MEVNGYRCMWIVVMFDLPTDTKRARREYALFRKFLIQDGFMMTQYSVYSRCCPSHENMNVHIERVQRNLPPNGEVRILPVTDKQFEKMRIFFGKVPKPVESTPSQLELF